MPPADAGRTTRALRATGRFLLWMPWPVAALLAVAWGMLIWDLSSHKVRALDHPLLAWELISNLAHAPLFGLLTLFVAALFLRDEGREWPTPRPVRIALVMACTLGYGLLDEWHQSRVPGRDASLFDVLTDVLSGGLVLWIVFTLGREGLREKQLLVRLAVGVVSCVGSAALALLS